MKVNRLYQSCISGRRNVKKKQKFSVTGFRIMKMRDQKQAQN